jgi:hypothetical protein
VWSYGKFMIYIYIYIYKIQFIIRSRNSVVGIATDYGLDDREFGFSVPMGSRIFFSPHRPYRL